VKSLRKVESLIEKIKPLDPPERFEKRDGEIYGLKSGEWKRYTLEELTALKDTIKERYEAALKRFDPMDIEVSIVDDNAPREPGPLHKWPDGWILEERGITNLIVINGDEED